MESRSSPRDKNEAYRFNQGMTEVGRREKNKEWVTKSKDNTKTELLWIITCCGEAKLTVLGTSYAIWVETPPMSNTPAVLCLIGVSIWSLPGSSITASSSSKIDRREMTDLSRDSLLCNYYFYSRVERPPSFFHINYKHVASSKPQGQNCQLVNYYLRTYLPLYTWLNLPSTKLIPIHA